MNVRDGPTKSAGVLHKLMEGDYVQIIDGPVQDGGYTWWKVNYDFSDPALQGWVMENPEWYERAWGQ